MLTRQAAVDLDDLEYEPATYEEAAGGSADAGGRMDIEGSVPTATHGTGLPTHVAGGAVGRRGDSSVLARSSLPAVRETSAEEDSDLEDDVSATLLDGPSSGGTLPSTVHGAQRRSRTRTLKPEQFAAGPLAPCVQGVLRLAPVLACVAGVLVAASASLFRASYTAFGIAEAAAAICVAVSSVHLHVSRESAVNVKGCLPLLAAHATFGAAGLLCLAYSSTHLPLADAAAARVVAALASVNIYMHFRSRSRGHAGFFLVLGVAVIGLLTIARTSTDAESVEVSRFMPAMAAALGGMCMAIQALLCQRLALTGVSATVIVFWTAVTGLCWWPLLAGLEAFSGIALLNVSGKDLLWIAVFGPIAYASAWLAVYGAMAFPIIFTAFAWCSQPLVAVIVSVLTVDDAGVDTLGTLVAGAAAVLLLSRLWQRRPN